MSWWNSSNLTSFASQALKTAQKRIDKVLDIGEDGDVSPPPTLPNEPPVESPKSPETKSAEDGDTFWNAWLGEGGSEQKQSEKMDAGSLSKVFTSGFKSERTKSKVEEAIMSTSIKSQKDDKSKVTTEALSPDDNVTSSVAKKGSPLKLTSKLGKKKSESKAKTEGQQTSQADDLQDEKEVEDVCQGQSQTGFAADDASSSVPTTDFPEQSIRTTEIPYNSDSQAESRATTKLAITDMMSSVSDGWTVEGWAADGQLEDLLQTSLMQNLEDEEDKASEGECGMTRSLSSSSGVTVQDLEPSLVVADPEDDDSGSDAAKSFVIGDHKSMTETATESVTVESEISERQPQSHKADQHTEDPQEEVPRENAEVTTSEVSTDAGSSEEISKEDVVENVIDIEESIETHGASDSEEPTNTADSNAEIVIENNESPTDSEVKMDDSSSVEVIASPEETVDCLQNFEDSETPAKYASEDQCENDSKDSNEEKRTDDNQWKAFGDTGVDAEVDTEVIQDSDGFENQPGSGHQEKKASVWVEEMCQLKDSITSTTASDELSDSNQTITSEDVGELIVDVGDDSTVVPEVKLEVEGDSDVQQDQMTLKVASFNEMVSSTISSSSSLVRNMEDAMAESLKDNDSHSTASTEKSSEMVRIESGHNSGHTSGDEIETTTSSDIEIISTPNSNGEYKLERPFEFSPLRYALSRTVRHSPPGHKRSDSSSSGQSNWSKNGDDMLSPEGGIHTLEEHWPMVKEEEDGCNNPLETDRLLKKLAEMAEVVEARENKLMELSRESIDLQEANNILRQQLQQSEEAREVEMSDLTTLTEEFTKRLSEAEKKYTTLARERDGLKRQLKDTETILARRSDNSAAVEKILKEKDLQITELLAEGEKLSKQQLQSNNIIKKLRNKEKENEALIKSQNEKIEIEGAELEHLRKVLDVKEDLEKKQIEAINQLNNRAKKQEVEINKMKSESEDYQEKIRSIQVTLDNSYKEIAELHKKSVTKASEAQEARLCVEVAAKEELQRSLERHQVQSRQENEALITQIEDLRLSLTRMEKEHARKEDILRQEISDLQQRLQEAEDRNQELTQGVSAATRPLLRQIENLQSTYAAQSSSFEKIERSLTERLADAQAQLATATEKERNASEKFLDISTRIKGLESQVSILRQEKSTLSAQLEMERAKVEALEDTRHSDVALLEAAKSSLEKELVELKKQQHLLENQLEMEKMKVESEKKKAQLVQDAMREKELEFQLQQSLRVSPEVSLMTRSSHAGLSRESSFNENMSHSLVLPDDGMEKSFMMVSPNGNKMSLYETLRQTGASTLIENLHSQLKLREGEISQLHSDITELEKTREAMARELVSVSNENETLESKVQEFAELKTKFNELDNRYNALLMMYGEKVEEADELKLDLQDVKDMYKAQIEELVNKR